MSHRRARARRARPLPLLLFAAGLALAALGGCSSAQEIQISALHFFKQGNEALEQQDYPQAIQLYRRVLALDDRAAAAHYNLGLALFEMQAYDQAAESFERALALYPDQPAAHYNLALTYDRLYDLPQAHAHYNAYRELVLAQEARQERGAATARVQPPAGAPAAVQAVPTQAAPGAGRSAIAAAAAAALGARAAGVPGMPGAAGAAGNPQGTGGMGTAGSRSTSSAAPTQVRPAPTQVRPTPRGPAAAARAHETDEMLGGSDKWWIQDRFIQNQ